MNVVTAVRDLGRLREISTVLVRHGFGEIVTRAGFGRGKSASGASEPPPSIDEGEVETGEEEKKRISSAERARLVLQDLGPSFIKLGQIVSTRQDVLPREWIVELRKLQDEVPPVPFEEIKAQVESSLGKTLDEVYVTFEEKPLATASIGQVHRATIATPSGNQQVVVKVQRPNVANTVARDLEILHFMAAGVERAIPETKIYSPVGLVQQFDQSITNEMNFTIEADNAERFAKNFEGFPNIRFPKVYREASSKQVLTLEFFDGRKIDQALKEGYDGKQIAQMSVGLIIKMIYEDGFFHADPHPGNIIIMGPKTDPIIGLIDVGMVGRLSPELRDRSLDLLVAAVRQDTYAVADALYEIGRPTKKVDMREYRGHAATLAEKYLGRPLKEIELSGLIRDLAQGAIKYGIEIPADFMLVGKALMTLEGIGKQLDPDLDLVSTATPHVLDKLKKRYSPQRIGNEVWRGVEQLSRAGYDLPMQVREILDDLRLGRLALKTVAPELAPAADRAARRIFMGLVIAVMLASGTALIARGTHDQLGIGMYVAAGVCWLFHAIADRSRRPKKE